MSEINKFLNEPRRNSFIPLLALVFSVLITARLESLGPSHYYLSIFTGLISILLGGFGLIFSIINAIYLYKQIELWTGKDILIMLLTIAPVLFAVLMLYFVFM